MSDINQTLFDVAKSRLHAAVNTRSFASISPSHAAELLDALSANEGMRKALEFYADPDNWADTPSWDGDPTCITPKGIPVIDTMTGECDCGETARAALSPALNSKLAPAGEGEANG